MLSREWVTQMVRSREDHIYQRTRFNGTYFGLVEDNRDPRRLNRLRIRTPVHSDAENLPTQALPWAHYCAPSGGDADIGFYFVPPVGAQVAVTFIDGDPAYPVWMGTVWGAPQNVSETHVNFIDEADPYALGQGLGWDFTKYNSLTTTSGHLFELDDNFFIDTSDSTQLNYRRIGLETRGAEMLAYSGLGVQTFTIGAVVVGSDSLARGQIVSDAASELRVTSIQGNFIPGEEISDTGGATATLVSVTSEDGFYFRMREDKLLTKKQITPTLEPFKGLIEMGTRDQRMLRLDDEDETIRFDTPDTHFFEINSALDYIWGQTEGDLRVVLDDGGSGLGEPGSLIDISTPGDDPDGERGQRLVMYNDTKHTLLKGDEEKYFLELFESGPDAEHRIGMYANYPSKNNAGIEILERYSPQNAKGVVNLYAGDRTGTNTKNGLRIERPSSVSPFSRVFMYDDSDNPLYVIELITDTGQARMGRIAGPLLDLGVDVIPSVNGVNVWGPGGIFLYGPTWFGPPFPGTGSLSEVVLNGPFVSEYFRHTHELPFGPTGGTNGNFNGSNSWTVTHAAIVPGQTTTIFTSTLAPAPFRTTKVAVDDPNS